MSSIRLVAGAFVAALLLPSATHTSEASITPLVVQQETAQSRYAKAVPPGMRAYAFRVCAERLFGGFLKIPHKIDIVVTQRTCRDQVTAKVLLEDVLMLGFDPVVMQMDDGSSTIVARTVTVAVTPEQARLLSAEAVNGGELGFALRWPTEDIKPIDLRALLNRLERNECR
jgi:Flp pilus assembly protein CpaB